jgi:hypothetical protein
MRPDDFTTPVFPNSDTAVKTAPVAGNDPLSVAARRPVHRPLPVEEQKPTPYHLSYVSHDGQAIVENHQTIPLALASVRRLKNIGIIPVTSTDGGKSVETDNVLRTDGPTPNEFFARYPNGKYPPYGYAAKNNDGSLVDEVQTS